MTLVLVFVFGLIIGSFLNAIIYRLHIQESAMKGRSYCPNCKHQLQTKDLLPVISFILLQGKCRYCHKKISWQYPFVELATATVLTFVYWHFLTSSSLAPFFNLGFWTISLFTLFLIIIFVYDLRYYLILDEVIIPAAILGFILNMVQGISWWQMLIAGIVVGGFFLAQFVLSKGRWIGGGDIRLGFLMGIYLSWPQAIVALFLAYFLGSIIAIILLSIKVKGMKSQVPFGTFLSLASFITLLYGQQLLDWYLSFYLI